MSRTSKFAITPSSTIQQGVTIYTRIDIANTTCLLSQCDEGHPSCRNCQKSKRECLGYDPIFKAQPAPAAIQPAPSGSPSLQAAATTASPYPAPPQGYMSASNNPPYGPSLSTGMASPGSSTEPYDYTAAIDPALEGAGASSLQGQSYGGAQGYGQDPNSYSAGRGGASQFSIPLRYQLSSSVEHKTHGQYRTASLCFSIVDSSLLVAAYTAISGKRIKIDDLFALEGVPPPPLTPAPPMTANHDEMKTIYTTVYAPFIDKFLETRWFQTRGLNHLLQDSALCERFTTLISRYTMPHDFHGAAVTRSLEASVIWSIMSLCRRVASTPASSSGQVNYLEVNDGVQDASKRLTIFESLVTKQYIDTEVPAQTEITGNGTVFDNQLKYREREFWRLLEKFLTIHDAKEGAAKEIDDTLGACRVILDSRENRDVLYSIAIIRAVGQRVAEFPDRLPPPVNNSEQDNRTKLSVAKKFIESEAAGGGTNQVIQRLCGMAHRSWMLRR